MKPPAIASRADWTSARLDLLRREKALNRERDAIAEQRRQLPWVLVEADYRFTGPDGTVTLSDLFAGRDQLLVYHFMFGTDWPEGCPSCSFWADSFDGVQVHLAQRGVSLVCISTAPYATLVAYRERMGWSFPWYSAADSAFNVDHHVSFTAEQQASGAVYNFADIEHPHDEMPGISVFARGDDGQVYHTYSTYSRGLDPINCAYQLLDLVPRGRDEAGLDWSMAWLRRHDQYDAAATAN